MYLTLEMEPSPDTRRQVDSPRKEQFHSQNAAPPSVAKAWKKGNKVSGPRRRHG